MSIEQFETLSLTIGSTGLILYMLFIIYKLGRESKAGKFGFFVLFIGLAMGMFGFIAKTILVEVMGV